MNNWLYDGDGGIQTEDYYGFIYKITNTITGKFYIGKKSFIHNKRKKLGKKELLALPPARGRKPTSKVEQVDSGWRDYWGSSKELLADIKLLGEDKFKKQILLLCKTKKQLTYFEIEHQVLNRILFIDSYNDNINGSYFRKDFEKAE